MEKIEEQTSEETQVLSQINFEQLADFYFSPADVYIILPKGKKMKIISAGSPVDLELLNKYQGRPLLVERVTDYLNVERGKTLWTEFKMNWQTLERNYFRDKILLWFKNLYWDGNSDGSLLDLMSIGETTLYRFDEEATKFLKNMDIDLFVRNCLVGSINAALAMAMGYTDYDFLSDIYHISFLVNLPVSQMKNFAMNQALEKERQAAGGGAVYLKAMGLESMALDFEKNIFNQSDFAKDIPAVLLHVIADKGLLNHLRIVHERIGGQGRPKKLSEFYLSDLENILIMTQMIFPYAASGFKKNDGKGFIKKACENLKAQKQLSLRMEKMLEHIFETLDAERILAEGA